MSNKNSPKLVIIGPILRDKLIFEFLTLYKFGSSDQRFRIDKAYIFRTEMNPTFTWAMPNKSIPGLPIT